MPVFETEDYEPIIGFTATVKVDDTFDTLTNQAFTNPLTITVPKRTWGEFEATRLNQANYARDFKPTLLDNGEMQIEGFFSRPEHERVQALAGNGGTGKPPTQEWVLTSPDPDDDHYGLTATFDGWVKEVGEIKFEKDKEVMFAFTVRIRGAITYGDTEP